TKKKNSFVKTVCKKLKLEDRWISVEPVGLKGGILLWWDRSITILDIICRDFCIEVCFLYPGYNIRFWGVFVYLSTDKNIRKTQWQSLIRHRLMWGDCWFLGGDFNDLLFHSEKKRGKMREDCSFISFRNFVRLMGMQDGYYQGYPFTWANNRQGEGFVEERLDRIFFSPGWLLTFPLSNIRHIQMISSDHYLLLLHTDPEIRKGKKRFTYDARWETNEGYKDVVAAVWKDQKEDCGLVEIQKKLRDTRLALLKWNTQSQTNSAKQIEICKAKLQEMALLGKDKDWKEWECVKAQLHTAYLDEEIYWQNKSRILWLKAGDKNTRYFHASVTQRRRANNFDLLTRRDGSKCKNEEENLEEILEFYREIFQSQRPNINCCSLDGIKQVNIDKSTIMFSKNTSGEAKAQISQNFQGIQIVKSSKYLGLPLGLGRSKKSTFKYVFDCVLARISSWKNCFLSDAGWLTLINAVLSAMPLYVMSCFKLPSSVCRDIRKSIADFWW
ncbi:Unknown protein, partial [Striga hermonthica]